MREDSEVLGAFGEEDDEAGAGLKVGGDEDGEGGFISGGVEGKVDLGEGEGLEAGCDDVADDFCDGVS